MSETNLIASGEAAAQLAMVAIAAKAAAEGRTATAEDYLAAVGTFLSAAGRVLELAHPGNAKEAEKLYIRSLRRHAAAMEKKRPR